MQTKPRVGLILLRAEWFDSVVALPELVEGVRQDAAALEAAFPRELELAHTWTVNSNASLMTCTAELRSMRLDLVLLAFQVWAEDFFLNPLVEAVGNQPLAVWCYQPSGHPPRPASFVDVLRYSGPVGTLEGPGTLRNLGVSFAFLAGAPGSKRFNAELVALAKAGQLRQALRQARFGLLPARNEQMQSTFVDEFRLRAELGPTVEYLSVGQLAQAAQAVPEAEVEAYLTGLRHDYPIRPEVTPTTLERAARAALGMAHLTLDHRLDVLSLNDISPELHAVMGLRPCLYPPLLAESGALWGLEGDLGAATAVFALNRLSGSPVFFTEFWFWDEAENLLVGGHAGVQDPRTARPGEAFISQDYEYCQSDETEGAHFQFACHSGQVTLLQLRCTPDHWPPTPKERGQKSGGFAAICCGGAVVDQPAWIEGYPHAILRPDVPVLDFLRQAAEVGTTQHWALAYGDARAAVRAWCEMAGVHLKMIDPTNS